MYKHTSSAACCLQPICQHFLVIYETQDSVFDSISIPNLPTSKCSSLELNIRMKYFFKPLTILGQIQSKRSPIFMIIKITFPNLLHNTDFYFYFHKLLMSLRNHFLKACRKFSYHNLIYQNEKVMFEPRFPFHPN